MTNNHSIYITSQHLSDLEHKKLNGNFNVSTYFYIQILILSQWKDIRPPFRQKKEFGDMDFPCLRTKDLFFFGYIGSKIVVLFKLAF